MDECFVTLTENNNISGLLWFSY